MQETKALDEPIFRALLTPHRSLGRKGFLIVMSIFAVTWLGTGAWDPCNFATTRPIRSIADLDGLRVYMFPNGGRFMSRFGVNGQLVPYYCR